MKTDSQCQSAIVLGMHDAIVSLTGLIAGLSFAFRDSKIIIVSCIISSITASLSMGAANYLATKTINPQGAVKSAWYTFAAYMATCVLLILPFFVFDNREVCLMAVVLIAILIIFGFNRFCYRGKIFYQRFFEMLSICSLVSIVAFFIGEIASNIFGI